MTFLKVDQLPQPGRVGHALERVDDIGGAGAVAAVQMARLSGTQVDFFTALGRDDVGRRSLNRLNDLGVRVHVAWRDGPTRQGISMVGPGGDRAITVIGPRLQPEAADPLPWQRLSHSDGVFVTAADAPALVLARQAHVLTATPRLRQRTFRDAQVTLDALIGSGLDPDEQLETPLGFPTPTLQIATEGSSGGRLIPGGRYDAITPLNPLIDSYGCGDSFAAGVTLGLAAGRSHVDAVTVGADIGARCSGWMGPFEP